MEAASEEEQDGVSIHLGGQEKSQIELELRLLEALEMYPPSRLQEEVLQLLDRFYNLEAMKPEDEEAEILNKEDEFSLPQSFFIKDE